MKYYVSLPSGFNELHPSVLHHIFDNLSERDLSNCSKVCTAWYQFLRNKNFWIKRLTLCSYISKGDLECILHYDNEDVVLTCLRTACLYQTFFSEGKDKKGNFHSKYSNSDVWTLTEKELKLASSILLIRAPNLIKMTFNTDQKQLDYLEMFLMLSSANSCRLYIEDKFTWRNENTYSDELYQKFIQNRCSVLCFYGRLSPSASESGILVGIEHVFLGVNDGQDLGLLETMFSLPLKSYGLRISANSTICNFKPYIDRPIFMYITGLKEDDEQWLVQALLTLASEHGFGYLYLANCEMSVNGIGRAVESIADAGIIIYQLHISFVNKSNDNLEDLGLLIRQKLKCSLFMYDTEEEFEKATDHFVISQALCWQRNLLFKNEIEVC